MRIWMSSLLVLILGGCQSTGTSLPETDFQGKVPADLNAQLLKLNDQPIQSFRGQTVHVIYQEDRALVTIVQKLRSARWTWDMHKSQISDDVLAQTCRDFGDAIDQGLGVRTWFAGSGGFVTDIVKAGDCDGLK
ncbi:hypothetical protein G5S52_10605 [Grimontia sp. S25]|uniref:Lipoprotein n=1 Tax=Grimontia sedimenti TaxID=2711294 RepID=A0A6M1RKP4_9GAMM|nr:hypothetical protein [Grimontia sedimenti]NGN98089.1 hypothetical protein [Grimontia sedimenti]